MGHIAEHLQLTCFYVSKYPEKEVLPILMEYLSCYLPSYMLPNHYVRLNQFPLNRNGKIDINLLSSMSMNISDNPRKTQELNPIQERLLTFWQKVLNLKYLNMDDNLITQGIDSIQLLKLAVRIEYEYKIRLFLNRLMPTPTVGEIYNQIKNFITVHEDTSIIF